jgi:integrase
MERLPGDGWKEALEVYKAQADDLHAGRTPRVKSDGLSVADLCNRFLTAKLRKLEAGELSPRSFQEYRQTTDRLIEEFDKTRLVDDLASDDFERCRADIAKRCGPVRLGNEITRIKSVFKYAVDNGLIERSVRFGSEFRKPDKSVMRRHRADNGKKLFTVHELGLMLDVLDGKEVNIRVDEKTGEPVTVKLKADPQLRAAILLGINAGAGNTDVANLQRRHLDLKDGWLNYPRGKTGIARRVPLWAETVEALKVTIAGRPEPKNKADENCVFLNSRRRSGTRLVSVGDSSHTDYVCRAFGKLLRKLEINGRKNLGFYSLRHSFATIGLQTADRDAVKALMGHAEGDMLAVYDETGPSDERLQAVVQHVHDWLFGKEGGAK